MRSSAGNELCLLKSQHQYRDEDDMDDIILDEADKIVLNEDELSEENQ